MINLMTITQQTNLIYGYPSFNTKKCRLYLTSQHNIKITLYYKSYNYYIYNTKVIPKDFNLLDHKAPHLSILKTKVMILNLKIVVFANCQHNIILKLFRKF